ncbi:MAG: hypothetical protein H6743_04285 [Rickettsiaceae bacterium]|nr:hypothetical protein [Rickettsiaceae bacterium]
MIKIRVKLTIVFCIRLLEASAYGAYRDPIAKTNINPKTDLFEKEIEDYGTFEKAMDALKEQAVNGITSSGTLELISDKTDDELKAAAGDLSSIRATELQAKGREEVLRTGIMEELHIDYTNPLNAAHQKDAVSIADASGDLLGKVLVLFKEFGIDCRAAQGNKVIEPEYHIEIKKEQIKDTVYTKTMCEEPRNKYNCRDILSMRCSKRGIRWGLWQSRQIVISGSELFRSGKTVFWVDHTGRSCFEYKLSVGSRTIGGFFSAPRTIPPNSYHVALMREFLVTKHPGSTLDNISTEMSSWWSGGLFSVDGWYYGGRRLGHKDYGWRSYTVNYQYRDGYPVCEQWSEDWSETCILQ